MKIESARCPAATGQSRHYKTAWFPVQKFHPAMQLVDKFEHIAANEIPTQPIRHQPTQPV